MQAALVLSALSVAGPTILRPFTEVGGDRSVDRDALEVDRVFSEEVESALLMGEVDAAVHCLKGVPTIDTPSPTMSAYLRRDDIRDCLVACDPDVTLATFPAGAKVATASLCRTVALRLHRPDINVVQIRGSVDERLRALHEPGSRIDALVVATCSMERVGLPHLITEWISSEVICPPLGAAIIALQTREDDKATSEAISFLYDPATATEAEAERLVLLRLGVFCNAPLRGVAERTGERTPLPTRRAPDPSRRTAALRLMFAAPAVTPGRRPWPSATS